jgi:hypothetical protein
VIDAVGAVGSVVVVVVFLWVIDIVGAAGSTVFSQPVPAVIVWPLVVDVVKTA